MTADEHAVRVSALPHGTTEHGPREQVRALVVVSRVEFMPGGLFFVFASAALACRTWPAMNRGLPLIIGGAVVWYMSHLIGSQVNCLADVEIDREHKARLAAATSVLGRMPIVISIGVEAAAALAVAGWLAASTGRPVLPLVWLAGFALAVAYSVEPVRLKRRGWMNPCCLVLILYALPMAFGYLTLARSAAVPELGIAAATGGQMLALILLNPAEDIATDRAAGIQTPCTMHGLRVIAPIAAAIFVAGTACSLWLALGLASRSSPAAVVGLLLAYAAQLAVCADLCHLAVLSRVSRSGALPPGTSRRADRMARLVRHNPAHFAVLGITFAAITGLLLR